MKKKDRFFSELFFYLTLPYYDSHRRFFDEIHLLRKKRIHKDVLLSGWVKIHTMARYTKVSLKYRRYIYPATIIRLCVFAICCFSSAAALHKNF